MPAHTTVKYSGWVFGDFEINLETNFARNRYLFSGLFKIGKFFDIFLFDYLKGHKTTTNSNIGNQCESTGGGGIMKMRSSYSSTIFYAQPLFFSKGHLIRMSFFICVPFPLFRNLGTCLHSLLKLFLQRCTTKFKYHSFLRTDLQASTKSGFHFSTTLFFVYGK